MSRSVGLLIANLVGQNVWEKGIMSFDCDRKQVRGYFTMSGYSVF